MTQKKIDELVRDNRRDEARAYRASFNVYDITEILLDTAKKTANRDEICFREEFRRLTAKISTGWKVSLEKAKKHEDYEKVMIEEAKLGVADSVIEKLNTLF